MSTTADEPVPVRSDPPAGHLPDGATPVATGGELAPPAVLGGRYRLDARLGSGSLAVTYRATDLALGGQLVAIKVFAPLFGSDELFRERFLDKARTAAQLVHPNIVTVLDAGLAQGQPYLVMEFVDGQSLRTLLQLRGRLSLHTAVNVAMQVADALTCAHEQGVIHADLRPENVLLDRQARAKVLDFGICHVAVATGVVSIDSIARRAAYLAPEQVRGDPIGPRTDVYALGVILYELLVGAPPLAGPNPLAAASRRLFAEPPRLRGERPDVSWGLEHVIRQALAPDPGDRWPSAQTFRAALQSPPHEDQRLAAPVGPPARRRGNWSWPGQALSVALPLLGTLLVVLTLSGLFDFLPPFLAPLQSVQVPDLRNRSFAEAEMVARGSGLEAVKARPEPCDQYGRDFVIRQEPDPNSLMRRGAKVRLTTCSGLRVPNLVGQREEQVRVQLVQRGWPVAEVRTAITADSPPGTIVAQEPGPDLIIPDKQPLVLTVAQAPR